MAEEHPYRPPAWRTLRADRVIYEDDAVLALDKPVGISVMGERHGDDLVSLAQAEGERLFPAHRIDKVTSGAVLLTKSVEVHAGLTRQFHARSVDRAYFVLTRTTGLPTHGTIDLPLSVGRKSRVRVAAPRAGITADEAGGAWTVSPDDVFAGVRSYPSVTMFARVWADAACSVLVVRAVTGRRHQIRVHLAWIGHPIDGDPLFQAAAPDGRTGLHSWRIAFDAAWQDGARLQVHAAPGPDFWAPVLPRLPGGEPTAVLEAADRAAEVLFASPGPT